VVARATTKANVTDWPPIAPELLARLSLDQGAFVAAMRRFLGSFDRRDLTEDDIARAFGYPWPRPPASFLIDGEATKPLDAVADVAAGARYPLLAFGSNGAPDTLVRKLAGLPPGERRLPVVAGDLHDFDVCAAAHPTFYASLPATLFPSPTTVLRASILWVSEPQLTALAWTEVSYHLGCLDGISFAPDIPGAQPIDSAYAFVSRWGAHCVEGEVAALAALPAAARTVPAYTQEELLGRLARDALGPGATARDLVAAIYEDFGAAAAVIASVAQRTARPFTSDRFTRFPSGPTA